VSLDGGVGGLVNVITVEAVLYVVEALQPEVFYYVEVTERAFPLGKQPAVNTRPVEGVFTGEGARLLARLQRVDTHRALRLRVVLFYHQQRHTATTRRRHK